MRSPVIKSRWVGYTAIAVVFAVACVLLSNWQFARRAEAAQEVALVNRNWDAPVTNFQTLGLTPTSFNNDLTWRSVALSGEYLVKYATLVRNRVSNSEAGFDTLVPFRTASGFIIVVDRGWLSAPGDGSVPKLIPLPPSGLTHLVVKLRPTERAVNGQSETVSTIPSLNVASYARRWSLPTFTGFYGSLVSETPSSSTGALQTRPSLSEGNHLSYAFQWLAFGILGFVGLSWIIRREMLIARGATTRRVKKPGQDERDEDALIDSQHVRS